MRSRLVDSYTEKFNGVPMAYLGRNNPTKRRKPRLTTFNLDRFASPVPAAAGIQARTQGRPSFISGAVTANKQAEISTHGQPGTAAPAAHPQRSLPAVGLLSYSVTACTYSARTHTTSRGA